MPEADDSGIETVKDWLAPAVIVKGLAGVVVAPAGKPEKEMLTVPVKPCRAVTESWIAGLVAPNVALIWVGDAEREKSPTGGGGGCCIVLPQFVRSPRAKKILHTGSRSAIRRLRRRDETWGIPLREGCDFRERRSELNFARRSTSSPPVRKDILFDFLLHRYG